MALNAQIIGTMREADVRAEIIDPIIARLGYAFGQTNYVQRERSLRYPKGFIGHKSKRDLPLGAADYVCGVDGRRGSFTVEAKRGALAVTIEDIEQAHSYAAHPEIRADFFVLCNGIDFRIFETLRCDAQTPLLVVQINDIETNFFQIAALLAPENLERNCSKIFDVGRPIASNYGSSIKFYGGYARTTSFTFKFDADDNHPIVVAMADKMKEMQNGVSDLIEYPQPIRNGNIIRDSDGRIHADVIFGSAHPKMEHNLISMGLHEISFFTDSETLDGDVPISFETMRIDKIPIGTQLYPNIKGNLESININTEFDLYINCFGKLEDGVFSGEYDGLCIYAFSSPFQFVQLPNLIARLHGEFKIELLERN